MQFESLQAADPSQNSEAAVGPLISAAAGQRVNGLLQDALSKGASLGGGNFDVQGAIAQPVFITGVKPGMDIYYQESFGPTVALYEFETTEEAIKLANDTEYGLVASVYSENITEALAVARKIRSGSCHINGPTIHGMTRKVALDPSMLTDYL